MNNRLTSLQITNSQGFLPFGFDFQFVINQPRFTCGAEGICKALL